MNPPPLHAPVVVQPTSTTAPLSDAIVIPDEAGRWQAWVTKGHVADRLFAEKARAWLTLGVALALGAAGLWVIFGEWR